MSIPKNLDTIVLGSIIIDPTMGLRDGAPVIVVRVYDSDTRSLINVLSLDNEQEYREFVDGFVKFSQQSSDE